MNSIKFLMALAAVCMLVVPAFSMLDNGMGQDCKQNTCDCVKSPIGYDGKQMWQGHDDKQKSCDCQKPCDCKESCDCKEPCDCQKSMIGPNDKQKMCFGQDGKQKECGCQESMMGQDGKQKVWLSRDGKQNECGCQESMMGPEGKRPMSMMGQDCKHMNPRHVKSMMGDRNGDGNGGIKIVIVNLRV